MSNKEVNKLLKENHFTFRKDTKRGEEWSDGENLIHVRRDGADILAVNGDIKRAIRKRSVALTQKLGECLLNAKIKPKEPEIIPPKNTPQVVQQPPVIQQPPLVQKMDKRVNSVIIRRDVKAPEADSRKEQIYELIKWFHYEDHDHPKIIKELEKLSYRLPSGWELPYVITAIKEMRQDGRISDQGQLEYLRKKLGYTKDPVKMIVPKEVAPPQPSPGPSQNLPGSMLVVLNDNNVNAEKKVKLLNIWAKGAALPPWMLKILSDKETHDSLKVTLIQIGLE